MSTVNTFFGKYFMFDVSSNSHKLLHGVRQFISACMSLIAGMEYGMEWWNGVWNGQRMYTEQLNHVTDTLPQSRLSYT